MAKGLTFSLGGKCFDTTPQKIERKKLYGWQEKVVYGEDGKECALAYTDDSGSLVMPRGGVGHAIMSPEGEWVERNSLVAITLDGAPAELITSSYNKTNALAKIVAPEEFLNHTITAAYQLNCDSDFCAALRDAIYTFDYIYRDGYETTSAFVLQSDGSVFMLLGYDTCFEMLSLHQSVELDEENEDEYEDEDEEIDFSFM